ncbi:MAG: right-handed parallel beta-helix repeat-containing protein [Anaerolineae bacterium]|nr:right-handed parallel beta-helix repeat-containing protein [Anaerolineae bacterium]
MASKKISEFTVATAAALDDSIPFLDADAADEEANKRIAISGLLGPAGLIPVTQAGHGFTLIGTPVYTSDGSTWAAAAADDAGTVHTGVIASIDGDDLVIQQSGVLSGITFATLTPGEFYFLADDGSLSLTEGTISAPVLQALTSSSALILPYRASGEVEIQAANITDATATGRAVLTATTVAAAQQAIDLEPGPDISALRSIRSFGAPMDGGDDGPAIQDSFDTVGYAYLPPGTATVLTPVIIPSNGLLIGAGRGVSTVVTDASLSRTARMFSTAGVSGGARVASNITIRGLTFDDARVWPSYPNSGWNDNGYLVYLNGVDGYTVSQCEFKNCQSQPLVDVGCKDGNVFGNWFHDNGRVDQYSPAYNVKQYGEGFTIVDISRANPAEVTVYNHAATWNAAATSAKIGGVTGFDNISDGVYSITSTGTNKFTLTGVDTSAEPSAYVCTQVAWAGASSGSGANYFPAQNTLCHGNHFEDNVFHHVAFHPQSGIISNNLMRNTAEAAIFISGGINITVANNKIDEVGVISVVGAGVEANRCADITIVGNTISNTATYAVSSNSMEGGNISNNVFRDIITDNTATYPAWAGSPGGGLIDKFGVIKVGHYDAMSGSNIVIADNTVIDTRKSTTAKAENFVAFVRQGSTVLNKIYDVSIHGNNLARSAIPVADMFKVKSTTACVPEKIWIRNNIGHNSQGPYVIEQVLSSAETGVKTHSIGFVPSHIDVFAYNPSVIREWRSECSISRTPAGNVYSSNYLSTIDGSAGRQFSTTSSAIAYQVVDTSGTLKGRGTLYAWICDSTNGIGLQINVTHAVDTITYRIVCYP